MVLISLYLISTNPIAIGLFKEGDIVPEVTYPISICLVGE
ncbi:MAG: hypothetical protein CM15mP112_06800 [Flavobacteriales bacterium]|nr:MAG: hypothetical protein CM15mP112_06800 [Flavobacteriales bacterium]